jgi:hypothetical protein
MTQQELARKVNQLKPEYQVRFNKEQSEYFEATKVALPETAEMGKYRMFAMIHLNEISDNISLKYWQYLLQAVIPFTDYSITDVVTLSASIEKRTFFDWMRTFPSPDSDTALKEWMTLRNYFHTITELVNPVIEDFTVKLLDKLLRTQHLDISGQSRSIPVPTGNHNPDTYSNPLIKK